VRAHYTCESAITGTCSGVTRLVPVKSQWKAHNVFMHPKTLRGHPEASVPLDDFAPNHSKRLEQSERARELVDKDCEGLHWTKIQYYQFRLGSGVNFDLTLHDCT
jgi:hypothetical protein